MREVFIDFETYATAKLSLRRMSLREYLSRTHVTGFAWAVDDSPVSFTKDIDEHRTELEGYANDPDTILVAHNTSFDLRVWRDLCGLPWPCRARCSQGLARAAWPAQPGTKPYALGALAQYLGLAAKLGFDAATDEHEGERFEEYNKHDVELCRAIYRRAVPRISPDDLRIAELCQRSREMKLIVDPARVHAGLAAFEALVDKNADAALCAIAGVTDADDAPEYIKAAFGWNGDKVKSVKPHVLKELLERELGFHAASISMKKLEPGRLAANPVARDTLKAAAGTNRALSHVRRVAAFAGQAEIDCELSEFAAHTYRFASTSTGRGVNLLNLPKHDKDVAKPVRSMFRLPPDLCWVSADAANVEYRIERWLAGCEDMFAADPFLDPYIEFGYQCTGVRCIKTDPIRQIWKMAVLGLGFLMGMRGFANVLSQALGKGQLKLEALKELIVGQSWTASFGKQTGPLMAHCREIGAPPEIGIVAGNVHKLFHSLHPEFRRLATWLEYVCTQVSSSPNPERAIERAYLLPTAPDRRKLNLIYEPALEGRSIRVQVGEWGPTLVWRDIAPRNTLFGFRLTSQAGRSKGFRSLSPNILAENITQACARNAMCQLMLAIEDQYPYQLCVHDEIKLLVSRDEASIRAARDALIAVGGPGNSLGYGNAFMLDPNEVTVSASWYDGGVDWPSFWANPLTPEVLKGLP